MILFILLTTILGFVALFCSSLAYAAGSYVWCDWTSWAGWGALIVSACSGVSTALVGALENAATAVQRRWLPAMAPEAEGNWRGLLRVAVTAGIVVASIFLGVYGLWEALKPPCVREVAVAIEGLPPELEGFRIAQITDLHISPAIRRNWVQDLVLRVNSLNPDVIAFTGDIADDDPAGIREDADPLAGLTARSGKFFVTGNHEYIHGAEAWMREMADLGFTVLRNDHRLVARGRASVLVGGVADLSADVSSPAAALGDGAGADVKILLAHRPESVDEAAEAGFDLQLSGHTHGGLILPCAWLMSLVQPYQSGLYRHRGTQLYVSSGAGYWGVPLRLGVPSEIALLTLARAK